MEGGKSEGLEAPLLIGSKEPKNGKDVEQCEYKKLSIDKVCRGHRFCPAHPLCGG